MIGIGMRVGRLVVIGKSTRKGYVTCKCDCGATKDIRSNSLTQKSPVQSCGCIQREHAVRIGSSTAKENFSKFYSENRQYNTNFHIIESDKPQRNTRSGCKGVWFNEKRGMWDAYISIHKTRIFLGRFHEKDDAIKARKLAEAEYFEPLIQLKRSTNNVNLGEQEKGS